MKIEVGDIVTWRLFGALCYEFIVGQTAKDYSYISARFGDTAPDGKTRVDMGVWYKEWYYGDSASAKRLAVIKPDDPRHREIVGKFLGEMIKADMDMQVHDRFDQREGFRQFNEIFVKEKSL